MFNGIVKEIGTAKQISIASGNITVLINSKKVIKNLKIGGSVSLNGVCQTITSIYQNSFQVEIIQETQKITTLKYLKINDDINLENPAKIGEDISGHLVTGHVDGIGKITNVIQKRGSKLLSISVPKNLTNFIARKGSIAIDGVSLTITDIIENNIKTAIIPHTYQNTIFKNKKVGDWVNIETDIMAKYAHKTIIAHNKSNITKDMLFQNGFI